MQRFARGDHQRADHPLGHGMDMGADRGISAPHQQRGRQQYGFPSPQHAKSLKFGGAGRCVLGAQHVKLQSDRGGGGGGDILRAGQIVAAQMDHGVRSRRPGPRGCDAVGERLLLLRDQARSGVDGEQGPQALVEQIDAGQKMQDTLVDAQRRGGEGLVRLHLDQPPAAQRARRRQRAPMRLVERAERGCEGRAVSAIGLGPARGELRVHLDAGAKQQHLAFERGKIEGFHEHVDRRRGSCLRSRRPTVFRIVRGRIARDPPPQPRQLRG